MSVSSPKPVRGGISWLPPRLLPPRGHTRAATIAGQGMPKKTEGNRKCYPARKKLHGVLQTVASTFTSLSIASIRRLPKE